jgi:hypothetical protein
MNFFAKKTALCLFGTKAQALLFCFIFCGTDRPIIFRTAVYGPLAPDGRLNTPAGQIISQIKTAAYLLGTPLSGMGTRRCTQPHGHAAFLAHPARSRAAVRTFSPKSARINFTSIFTPSAVTRT